MAQRMGYPMFQPPSGVNPLTMPYGGGPGQNVYVTPVQQRPDGMGGMLWSPYDTPVGVSLNFLLLKIVHSVPLNIYTATKLCFPVSKFMFIP